MKFFRHNTLRIDSQVIFPVKHYESWFDLLVNIPYLSEPVKKEQSIHTITEYINTYHESDKQLLNLCYGENSVTIGINVVSHFPSRVRNGLEDIAQTIMNPANCRTSKITVSLKDNPDFTEPEPIYAFTHIIKPNLVGDLYVKLLTTLDFTSSTVYHRYNLPLYKPVEQSL